MSPRIARLSLGFAALLSVLAAPVLLSQHQQPRVLLASAILGAMLSILAAFDFDQLRLPDLLTLPLLATGLAATAWIGAAVLSHHIIAAPAAGLVLGLVGDAYRRLRGREGLGFGDVKLFAALAAWVGPDGLLSVLFIACVTALCAVVTAYLLGRRDAADTPVPFGIFLALGGWITWIYGPIL